MARPVLYLLAGVNGAGKSSIGDFLLTSEGVNWRTPQWAKALVEAALSLD